MKIVDKRTPWVDTVKALGMFLVYYGHFIERGSHIGNETAFSHFQFIYSFHMPLFFMLSGFFFKSSGPFFKKLFLRRIIPVFVFGALLIPFWILYYRISFEEIYWSQLAVKLLYYLKGHTEFNLITWFLVCLFICEIIANSLSRTLKSKRRAFFTGMSFLLFGILICQNLDVVTKVTGVAKNTWYIHESIVALGFYLIGNSIYSVINRIPKHKKWIFTSTAIFSFLILFLTYDKNRPYDDFVVMMINSDHGFIVPFLLAAFSGAFLIISISILFPPRRVFSYVGQHTIILLGLNGIFHHFINNYIVQLYFPAEWYFVTLYSAGISIISIAACYPLIQFFNYYLPQLVGKPSSNGPLLPDLENLDWHYQISHRIRSLNIFYTVLSGRPRGEV